MKAPKREISTHSHDARPSVQDRTRRASERAPVCGHQGRRPARIYRVTRRDHHKAVVTPTRSVRAELAAIRGAEAGIAGGACVTLTDLLRNVDQSRRTNGTEAVRRVSR